MKAYVATTTAIFGLLAVVHIWRAVSSDGHLAGDPGFIVATTLAAAFCLWGVWVLRRSGRK